MSTSTALTVQQQNQLALKNYFEGAGFKEELSRALPKHVKPDRFLRVALTAINQNEKILECDRQSIGLAMLKAAASGLDVGRECHIIPYGGKATYQVDYKGLAAMLRRSGEVADVHADAVREGDEFSYCYGTGSHLRHKPARNGRGPVTEFYSYVRFKDGSESFEVMSVEDVEYVRDTYSQGWKMAKKFNREKEHPWSTAFEPMGCKTVFKKHTKWLPLSAELADLIREDDEDIPPGFEGARSVNERPAMPAAAKGVAAMRQAETPSAQNAKPAEVVDAPMTVGTVAPQEEHLAGDPPAAQDPAPVPAQVRARRPRTPSTPKEGKPIDVPSTPVASANEASAPDPERPVPNKPSTEVLSEPAAQITPESAEPEPEWPKVIVARLVELVDQFTKNTDIGYRTETRDGVKHGVFKKVEIKHPKFSGVAYYTGKDADKLVLDTDLTLVLTQQPPQPGKPPVTMIQSIRTDGDLF